MTSVSQVNFCEDLGEVEAVQHLRYEGEGEPVFDGNPVQTPVIDNEAKLAIWALHKHNRGCSWRLRRADEAICKVRCDILLHFCEFWCRHRIDGTPRGGGAGLQGNGQVVLAIGRERIGSAGQGHLSGFP